MKASTCARRKREFSPRAAKLAIRRAALCAMEQFEPRLLLTTIGPFDSSTPVGIPIGSVMAGQMVNLNVNFSTTDPDDQSEGEPLIIQSSGGYSQTISDYGDQDITVPITQNNESLSAYIVGADGDESATIETEEQTVTIDLINFIPAPLVPMPGFLAIGSFAGFQFAGDNHGLGQSEDRFRTKQELTVVLGDNDGQLVIPGSALGPNGNGITGVSTLFINGKQTSTRQESPAGMQVTTTPYGNQGVSVDLSGVETNPYFDYPGLSLISGSITWDVTIDLQPSGNQIEYDISGTRGNFPAQEIDLNGQLISAASYAPTRFDQLYIAYGLHSSQNVSAQGFIAGTDDSDPLVITTEPPATITAGQTFGFTVTAQNDDGSTDTSFNSPVTVTSEDGNTLGGSLTVQAVNGVATFTGLTDDVAGSDILDANTELLPTASTNQIDISPAAATHLEIEGPNGRGPNNGISSPFGLDVDAEDPFGNIDTNFYGSVTLSLSSNPGNSTLGGTLTVQAEEGDASFEGLTVNNLGTGYTLLATSPGLAYDISIPFAISDQVAVTTAPPTTVVAGQPFGLVVEAQAGLGNVDTSYNGPISLTLSNYQGTDIPALLNGTLTAIAVDGVAIFSNLSEDVAGTYGLVVSGSGLLSTSTLFTVMAGSATQLVPVSLPPAVTVGQGFNVNVLAEDSYGNVDTTFGGTVSLSIANNPSAGVLSGQLSAVAMSGTASFALVMINATGTGYTLQATSSQLLADPSTPFSVRSLGAATSLVVATQLTSVTAGDPFALTVDAEDGNGTPATSYNGLVTLEYASTSSATPPLGGTLTAQAVNGVATFSGLTVDLAGDGYQFAVNANGLSPGTLTFNVYATAPTQLAFETPLPTVFSGTTFLVNVEAEDPYGNVDSSFYGNVTIALSSNPGNAVLGGTLIEPVEGGTAQFDDLSLSPMGDGYVLTANTSGLTSATSPVFDVVGDQLAISAQPPGDVPAGEPFAVTVVAQNSAGALDSSFNGTVTLSPVAFGSGSSGTAAFTATAVNGVATFANLSLSALGEYALEATAPGTSDSASNLFNVTTDPTQLAVALEPAGDITSGAMFEIRVEAKDSSGNLAPNFNGAITLALSNNGTSATLGGSLTAFASSGVATFESLAISQTGVGLIIQATAPGLSAAQTSSFDITPVGHATQLVITSPPPTSVNAGSTFGLSVDAEDDLGDLDSSYNGPVTIDLPANAGGLGATTINATGGIATFSSLALALAGSYTLSISGNLPSTSTAPLTVSALSASQLAVYQLSSPVLAGSPIALYVLAEDQYGNLAPTFGGTVSLTISGGATLDGTLTQTAAAGVAAFSGLSIPDLETGVTINASSSGLSGSSDPFDVTADALAVTTQPSLVASNQPFALAVSAENAAGSVDTSYAGMVTLSLFDSSQSPGQLTGTLSATAVNGVATFTGLQFSEGGYYDIAATGANAGMAISQAIGATPLTSVGQASQLTFALQPANTTAGTATTVVVDVEDSDGNLVTTDDSEITLSVQSGPGGLSQTLTAAAVNGVATFTNVTLNTAGQYTLSTTDGTLASAVSAQFTVNSGVATHFVFAASVANLTAGGTFPSSIIVYAEDVYGNVDPTYNAQISLGSKVVPTGVAFTPMSVTAVDGTATFTNIAPFDFAGGYKLKATETGYAPAKSNKFFVSAGAATQLVFSDQPTNINAGAAEGTITVDVEDAFGNILTDDDSTLVTLGSKVVPIGVVFSPVALDDVDGIATFTGVVLETPGGYKFKATHPGLTPGKSAKFFVAG
jgi:hypothetical protein